MRFRYVAFPAALAILATAVVVVGKNQKTECAATDSESTAGMQQESVRPNVVLISLDTLRPDHLGCYGYAKDTSPNLDRLASRGVVFRKTWTQAPWTLPSHMSLFTSLPPSRHRVDSLNRVLADGVVTLPQQMQAHGYHTAALVNNGQMRDHWGFDRGFDVWREFQVDSPEGNCEHITRQAVDWLDKRPLEQPFFLFLHYYDPHDAYDAPEPFRNRFGPALTGNAARETVWQARFPEQPLPSSQTKDELIRAYDAEIAWLDHELGKLFAVLPENTMVVVFSDHGEAFEEHGWTLHGATLYEEETRVALLMQLPEAEHAGRVLDTPAALMDVAPTILRKCGVDVPTVFQGIDLGPAMSGRPVPARIVTSETKAVLEGRLSRAVIAYPWKLIVSELDGSCELYRLPDETTNLASAEPAAVEALKRHVESGLAHQNYWLVEARGGGKHEIAIEVENGEIALFIPRGFERGRDGIQTSMEGNRIEWVTYPGEGTKSLYLEFSHANARPTLDVLQNDRRRPGEVFIGQEGLHPSGLPCRVPDDKPLRPTLEAVVFDEKNGVRILQFKGDDADSADDNTKRINEEILRQLRALKYVE